MANPIRYVGSTAPADTTVSNFDFVPSSFKWGLQDISSSDAGRTEDTKMWKNRIGQCVKIELSWQNITGTVAKKVLQAFNPEYIYVTYKDPMQNDYVTREFYVGDRSSPMYSEVLGIWNDVSFNIIERSGN